MMLQSALDILHLALRRKRYSGASGITELKAAISDLVPAHMSTVDGYGNLWVDTRLNQSNRTMFMGHLDTVHWEEKKTIQDIFITKEGDIYSPGSILGADDGAGIAMMVHIMLMGVPALYIFTLDEEMGGNGAGWIKQNRLKDIEGKFDRIISFDRKGQKDICGAQCCGNCASREFVEQLATTLDMGHTWATGSFTDNSLFKGTIKEIVNISIGYENAHSKDETLHMPYMHKLAERLDTVSWDLLPTVGPAPDPVYRSAWDGGPDDRWWERAYPPYVPNKAYKPLCGSRDLVYPVRTIADNRRATEALKAVKEREAHEVKVIEPEGEVESFEGMIVTETVKRVVECMGFTMRDICASEVMELRDIIGEAMADAVDMAEVLK